MAPPSDSTVDLQSCGQRITDYGPFESHPTMPRPVNGLMHPTSGSSGHLSRQRW